MAHCPVLNGLLNCPLIWSTWPFRPPIRPSTGPPPLRIAVIYLSAPAVKDSCVWTGRVSRNGSLLDKSWAGICIRPRILRGGPEEPLQGDFRYKRGIKDSVETPGGGLISPPWMVTLKWRGWIRRETEAIMVNTRYQEVSRRAYKKLPGITQS